MITVFTNGCFDILHDGHIDYLRKSRELGERLIVGLNSDESVKRLKGNTRPFNDQSTRLQNLIALEGIVDGVLIFNEDTPIKLIEKLKPAIITKGGDYKAEDVVGYGLAQVVIIPIEHDISTTDILKDMGHE